MTRPLLDFDDAGAQDDHPAKGVTMGDIRGWFDEIEQLKAYANHERSLGAEGPMIELVSARQEIEQLKAALGPGATDAWEYMYDEIERLKAGLQMLAKQEYDAGYTPEGFAEAILSGDEPAVEEPKR